MISDDVLTQISKNGKCYSNEARELAQELMEFRKNNKIEPIDMALKYASTIPGTPGNITVTNGNIGTNSNPVPNPPANIVPRDLISETTVLTLVLNNTHTYTSLTTDYSRYLQNHNPPISPA